MVILSVLTIKILNNFVLCLKVIEYCKSTTFQLKIKLSSLNFSHSLFNYLLYKKRLLNPVPTYLHLHGCVLS